MPTTSLICSSLVCSAVPLKRLESNAVEGVASMALVRSFCTRYSVWANAIKALRALDAVLTSDVNTELMLAIA